MPQVSSLDDVRRLLDPLPAPDEDAAAAVRRRDTALTKPPGSLGRLEEIAAWAAAWQGRHEPRMLRVRTLVFAGNHGVAARGVSAYPASVTQQMVANFLSGGAAINQICEAFGLDFEVHPLTLERPTADFCEAPALNAQECAEAFRLGLLAVEPDLDLICVGEMGIGNTTAAAALACALCGGAPQDWAGPGTGLDAAGVAHKAEVIGQAMALHGAALPDPLEALRRLGGREIAAMAGAIVEARRERVPVLLDGFVSTAAAAVLHALEPTALDHCLAGHCSAEPAHRRLLAWLGKAPLLDLGLRLGEGSGAALAAAIVKAAVATHGGMATFAEAGVATPPAND